MHLEAGVLYVKCMCACKVGLRARGMLRAWLCKIWLKDHRHQSGPPGSLLDIQNLRYFPRPRIRIPSPFYAPYNLRILDLQNEKILPIIPTAIMPGHLPSALCFYSLVIMESTIKMVIFHTGYLRCMRNTWAGCLALSPVL